MVLHFIGIGLGDEKDITLKGLEAIKKSKEVYLEFYTSKLQCDLDSLRKLYDKDIIIADRDLVESQAEEKILSKAKDSDVSFLVIGDIFSATTHIDLFLRAKEKGIKCNFIHNASIITAIGETGLEVYKFGKITSIPFGNENVKTPIDVFKKNLENNLHTLFLLDIDPMNDKFMKFSEAAEYIMRNGIESQTMAVGCAALGTEKSKIVYAKLSELVSYQVDAYPQCLIIPSDNMHFVEEDCLKLFEK